MYVQTKTDNSAARRSMSILHFFLDGFHPRDFSIRLWDGSTWEAEPGQPSRFTMVIRHPGAIRTMFLTGGERSLGQAYIYDDFDIEGNLESTFPMADFLLGLRFGITHRIRLASQLLRLPSHHSHAPGRQPAKFSGAVHSIERDQQAVTYHYNTSNDFFSLFLDKRMVYSCAYFATPEEDLDSAQTRKLDYVCRKLRLKQGERFLDIGCGWGGLIIHAAENFGVLALGITLSEPQAKLANDRIRSKRLDDRCRAEVIDYRRVNGSDPFDKVASIGMAEHVGESMLPEYFAQAWRVLRPGGAFLNHAIAHRPGQQERRGSSFSDAYVFPDSDPVPINVSTRVAELAGFEVRDVESLREHYALTLRQWVRRLEEHHEEAARATDETTYRVWRLFMSASAHGFDTGRLNVYQTLLVKPDVGRSGLPLSRADWYR